MNLPIPHPTQLNEGIAARSIESAVKGLLRQHGLTVQRLQWVHAPQQRRSRFHRLDIYIAMQPVRLYFTADELAAYLDGEGRQRTERRLRDVIATVRSNELWPLAQQADGAACGSLH